MLIHHNRKLNLVLRPKYVKDVAKQPPMTELYPCKQQLKTITYILLTLWKHQFCQWLFSPLSQYHIVQRNCEFLLHSSEKNKGFNVFKHLQLFRTNLKQPISFLNPSSTVRTKITQLFHNSFMTLQYLKIGEDTNDKDTVTLQYLKISKLTKKERRDTPHTPSSWIPISFPLKGHIPT